MQDNYSSAVRKPEEQVSFQTVKDLNAALYQEPQFNEESLSKLAIQIDDATVSGKILAISNLKYNFDI